MASLGLRRISAAGSTDRTAEPGNRLGLREWRFRNCKRRGFRPGSALERVADGYGRKGRVSAVAEACRIFGNAVARIDDMFRLPVLPQLQVGVRQKVEEMVTPGVFRGIGGGLRIDASRVGDGLVVGRAIRTDHLLPHAERREDVRGHVQCVRRRRCELRAARSSEHAPHGELGIVVAVNDVMRDAGVVGILRLQLFEDIGGLELLGIGLVGRVSRFVECQRIENRRLGVIGIARPTVAPSRLRSLPCAFAAERSHSPGSRRQAPRSRRSRARFSAKPRALSRSLPSHA